eukprot:423879-Amorphochlora_amoeboformis.AAC.2
MVPWRRKPSAMAHPPFLLAFWLNVPSFIPALEPLRNHKRENLQILAIDRTESSRTAEPCLAGVCGADRSVRGVPGGAERDTGSIQA